MIDFTRRQFLYTALAAQLERRPPGKRVLVAGAGLAGLTAAYELVRGGHDVTVLEAQARPGGRVQTLREPFSDGLHAEAGAVRIADIHHDALNYCREFGLELEPFLPPGDPVYVMQGRRIVERAGKPPDFPGALREDERGLTVEQLAARYAGALLGMAAKVAPAEWPPAVLRPFDELTLQGFYLRAGASPAAASLLTFGYELDTQSALWSLMDDLVHVLARKWYRIQGGNDRLPQALARKLSTRIRYGCPVLAIRHGATSVQVTVEDGGAQQQLEADALICTLPPALLRRVALEPAFRHDKMDLLQAVRMTAVSRVFLQMRERFWQRDKLSGVAHVEGPAMRFWPGATGPDKERGILHTYTWGRAALSLDRLDEATRREMVLRDAEAAFPGARKFVEGSAYKSWQEDAWQRGAFTEFAPGRMANGWTIFARAEGRVHFAGEHANPWGSWMQGSIESGLRAAAEVAARPWQPAPGAG